MAGRERDARLRALQDLRPDTSLPSNPPILPTREEVSICDAVIHLAPGIDPLLLLESLRRDAGGRRERVRQLRRRILAGEYHVAPEAVATAMLLEGELFLH
jgi:anti-sigma-28 factor FlgM